MTAYMTVSVAPPGRISRLRRIPSCTLPNFSATRRLATLSSAATISMRWMSGLYRSIISGAERLTWLGLFNSGIATLRFLLEKGTFVDQKQCARRICRLHAFSDHQAEAKSTVTKGTNS